MEIGAAFEVDQLADDDKGHRWSFKGGYRAATVARQLSRLARVGPSSGKSSQAGISKPYKVLSLPLLYNSGLIQHLHFFRQNIATVRLLQWRYKSSRLSELHHGSTCSHMPIPISSLN